MQFDAYTLTLLNDVPTGHQVNNYVRIARADVPYWQRQGKGILYLKNNVTSVLATTELPKGGKFFIIW